MPDTDPPASSTATVMADSYLTLHYSLADLAGNEYVSTFGLSPATLQMGGGQLAETLENCLLGLPVGARHVFELASADAFGLMSIAADLRINQYCKAPKLGTAMLIIRKALTS